ncbi:MAG: cytidylate kinase-like family protein [Bacteroidota bacterium]|nr:cytidylate kinase-like family protein [Bacteroidota bacterium]
MRKLLADYLQKSSYEREEDRLTGPVVTISRECGCSARRIAAKLSKILTGYSYVSETKTEVKWRWASREIIETAAAELKVSPEFIDIVMRKEESERMAQLCRSFSEANAYNIRDERIVETISRVIRSFAESGHYIIVGRGGMIFTEGIPDSLNIRLQAPLDWRINRIMQMSNLSHLEAEEFVKQVDRRRELFIEKVAGHKYDSANFDLVINYSTLPDDHIVNAIVSIMRDREMICVTEK